MRVKLGIALLIVLVSYAIARAAGFWITLIMVPTLLFLTAKAKGFAASRPGDNRYEKTAIVALLIVTVCAMAHMAGILVTLFMLLAVILLHGPQELLGFASAFAKDLFALARPVSRDIYREMGPASQAWYERARVFLQGLLRLGLNLLPEGLRHRIALSQEICPYCFETFDLAQTPFRCISQPAKCPPETDSVFTASWNDATPRGKVISSGDRWAGKARCPQCKEESHSRICPACHIDLPPNTGKCENLFFSIIGAKEAGKSHYLAVLINQLIKHSGPGLQLLLQPLDDYTEERYRDDFYTPVYLKKSVIEATRSASEDKNATKPLIYSLTCRGKGLLGGTTITKVVSIAFFDTAGEDLHSRETMSVLNKYIYRSQGIILLLDPLQLPFVRDRLDGRIALPNQDAETSDIVGRVTSVIQTGRQLDPSVQISIPLAVAFSKFDAVKPLVDAQSQLLSQPNHDSGFDVADFNAVNGEMRSLLDQWDGRSLVHQVTTLYRYHAFFGLSALGCNPHGSNAIPHVLPSRVEDPFLWLLHHHGIIGQANRPQQAC